MRALTEASESVGSVEVCVQIFNPPAGEPLNATLTVQLQFTPVTAGEKASYSTRLNLGCFVCRVI